MVKQTVIVALDTQELSSMEMQLGKLYRREITRDGALGIANNTGMICLSINGKNVVRLHLHEDDAGSVVLSVTDLLDGHNMLDIELEQHGVVPGRIQKAQRHDPTFT